MRLAAASLIFALALTLNTTIIIALGGAVAGTLALLVVLHNAQKLERFVENQTKAVKTLKERVDALEPPRPAG